MKEQSTPISNLKITILNYEDETTFPKLGASCIAFDTDGIPHQVFYSMLFDKDDKNPLKFWVPSYYDKGELIGKSPNLYRITKPIIAWAEMPKLENKTDGWNCGSYEQITPTNVYFNNNSGDDDYYYYDSHSNLCTIDNKDLDIYITIDKENNMSLASYIYIESKDIKSWCNIKDYFVGNDIKFNLSYSNSNNIKDICMWVKLPKLKKIVSTKYLFD